VRLLSKSGLDWTKRYPWVVETARKIRKSQFILDGEAVVLGVDGISDSTPCTLAGRMSRYSYAFDILAYNGDDLTHHRCICERPTWSTCCAAGLTVSLSLHSSRERSGQTCSTPPAAWVSRVWSQRTASAPTAAADANTGSK
jgi:hypothetical protein